MERQVQVGVGVLVTDQHQRLLLGKRKSKHGEGTWSPPGGHMEFGETPLATARRELFEETGLHIDNLTFCGISNDIFPESGKHYVTLFFKGSATKVEAKLCEPEKCESWQCFAMQDLPQPLFLPLQNFLAQQN